MHPPRSMSSGLTTLSTLVYFMGCFAFSPLTLLYILLSCIGALWLPRGFSQEDGAGGIGKDIHLDYRSGATALFSNL